MLKFNVKTCNLLDYSKRSLHFIPSRTEPRYTQRLDKIMKMVDEMNGMEFAVYDKLSASWMWIKNSLVCVCIRFEILAVSSWKFVATFTCGTPIVSISMQIGQYSQSYRNAIHSFGAKVAFFWQMIRKSLNKYSIPLHFFRWQYSQLWASFRFV